MVEPRHLPLFAWLDEQRVRRAAAAARLRRTARRALPIGVLAAALGATLASPPAPRLVWNASASAPVGLYRIAPGVQPARGELALVRLPPAARDLAARRHYLPANVPAIKRVAGAAGDRVCAIGDRVAVAGAPPVTRFAADRRGRALPRWTGCIVLGAGEIFLLNPASRDSFDGRYFGPVEVARVIGRADFLWAP